MLLGQRRSLTVNFASAVAGALLLIALLGCNSKPKASEENSAEPVSGGRATAASDQFDGGTYCAQTFMQGTAPAQPLHFSYKVMESDPRQKSKDFEADLAGDTMDLVHTDKWLATDQDRKFFQETSGTVDPKIIKRTITNGVAEETITNHAMRSDQVGWSGIVLSVTQGGTPWGLFVLKPTVSRAGEEKINGYDTVKYTVDTSKESEMDKSAGALRGMKDYNITGTAWVLKDAKCILQYDITDQKIGNDKSSTTHYQGSMTKK